MDVGVILQLRHSGILHVVPVVPYLLLPAVEAAQIHRLPHSHRLRNVSRSRIIAAHLRRPSQHEGVFVING